VRAARIRIRLLGKVDSQGVGHRIRYGNDKNAAEDGHQRVRTGIKTGDEPHRGDDAGRRAEIDPRARALVFHQSFHASTVKYSAALPLPLVLIAIAACRTARVLSLATQQYPPVNAAVQDENERSKPELSRACQSRRIQNRIDIVFDEAGIIPTFAGFLAQTVFHPGQRTQPSSDFDVYAPQERRHMRECEPRVTYDEKAAEDDEKDER